MNGDVMSMLSSIMQDPKAMEKAMSMASMLSSSGILDNALNKSEPPKKDGDNVENKNTGADDQVLKDLSSSATPQKSNEANKNGNGKGQITMNERLALLSAIRPYLSEDKAGKLDSVIRIMKIVNTLEKSGIKLF